MIRGRPDDLHNTHATVPRPQRQHRSVLPSPVPPGLPDRFRMFRSCEWEVLERSLNILQASDFYWGPLSVGEAHAKLQREPVGTYLVRDSSQGNCLFSLSVRMPTGPVSLRISFQEGYFRLKNWFSDCVVRLLELVVAGTRNNPLHFDEMGGTPLVFSEPLCRSRRAVPTLRELCRRRLPAGAAAAGDTTGTCPQEVVASPPGRRRGSEQSVGSRPLRSRGWEMMAGSVGG
nr:suppressor of cytokine signaling 1 [Anas platyrhynchos]XP_027309478.2 suppressor of cytokine signaling 1 [Anas platyrhynchos]XP_027309487.2 suppressor of cytokine signaling 1 [Anas platyrhynchos]XP_027309490.2 suppressor of cytokine signaling 1 [Anas platyrhynchos]